MRRSKKSRSKKMVEDLSFPKLHKVAGGRPEWTEGEKCLEPDMVCPMDPNLFSCWP